MPYFHSPEHKVELRDASGKTWAKYFRGDVSTKIIQNWIRAFNFSITDGVNAPLGANQVIVSAKAVLKSAENSDHLIIEMTGDKVYVEVIKHKGVSIKA